MTTIEEIDDAVLQALTKLCDLLDTRCQIKNNNNNGVALSLVPRSVAVAMLLPNSCQIAPTMHTSGPANNDPLFMKILSDVMVSNFCDSRIFARDHESDLQSSFSRNETQLNRHYPISFSDFDSIKKQHEKTNKTRSIRTVASNPSKVDYECDESDNSSDNSEDD